MPKSRKSSTETAPASRYSQRSLPLPDPVTFPAPARRPARVQPRIRAAATVVLPVFIPDPTTTRVGGRRIGVAGAGWAKSSVESGTPVAPTSPPTISTRVGSLRASWLDTTLPTTPPAVSRWALGLSMT